MDSSNKENKKIPVRILYSIRNDNPKSRSWREFEDEQAMAAELVDYYEEYLHCIAEDQSAPKTYKSDDLFQFLEEFFDELVLMVKENIAPEEADLWTPYGLPRIKEALYTYFWSLLDEQPTSKQTAQELMLVEQAPLAIEAKPTEELPKKLPAISPLHKHIENLLPDEDDGLNELDYSEQDDYREQPMEI